MGVVLQGRSKLRRSAFGWNTGRTSNRVGGCRSRTTSCSLRDSFVRNFMPFPTRVSGLGDEDHKIERILQSFESRPHISVGVLRDILEDLIE